MFFKKLIYFLSILTVITISLSYPIFVATKVLIKNSFESQSKYEELKKIIIEKNNFNELKNFLSNEKNYKKDFHFSKLKFIKSIVEQERVMSIGIDPMIAVMNDIKVIDGYHTIYSKSYKINFRKIISKELEANEILKNYYDIMGNRVYAFYSDKNKLLLNFKAAKTIGAEYVISAFPIKNPNLESICHNCRGNKDIFLYKIL